MRDLYIIAMGGFGRTVASLLEEVNQDRSTFNVVGFIDDHPSAENIDLAGRLGLEHVGDLAFLASRPSALITTAHGSGRVRHRLAREALRHGHALADIVHPTATIGQNVDLGPGVIMAHHSVVTTNVRSGALCLHNMFSIVGHDCRLADNVTLSPYASMLGGSRAEEGAWLATNSTLDVNRVLGAGSILAAGAVAVRDVPAEVAAKGVPARWDSPRKETA